MGEAYSSENVYVQNVRDLDSDDEWRSHFEERLNEGHEESLRYVLDALDELHTNKDDGLNFLEIYFLEQAFKGLDVVPEQYLDIHSEYIESREDDSIESWG